MRRRTLLGGLGSMVMLAPLAGCRPWLKRDPAVERGTDHQRATIAAMAATFVPSADGVPGAAEADATALILDPAFPVAGYLSELVSDLDDWCAVRHHHHFVRLTPAKRERALEERMGLRGKMIRSWYLPVYEGVLTLTKLAFFGGLRRSVGTTFAGFPGPSAGYAPNSAAGVHRARGPGSVTVDGAGTATGVWVTALIAGLAPADAGLRLRTPDGAVHAVPAGDDLDAPLAADRTPVPGAAGGAARGTWQLTAGPGAVVTAWWLALRTDLDDAMAGG